jgi:hypothetical protein
METYLDALGLWKVMEEDYETHVLLNTPLTTLLYATSMKYSMNVDDLSIK